MINFKQFLKLYEDVAGGTGMPANIVGANIAGSGGEGGEPGVSPKKKKSPILLKMIKRTPK